MPLTYFLSSPIVATVADRLDVINFLTIKVKRHLKGHQAKVLCSDWSPDKRHIVSSSQVSDVWGFKLQFSKSTVKLQENASCSQCFKNSIVIIFYPRGTIQCYCLKYSFSTFHTGRILGLTMLSIFPFKNKCTTGSQ